MLRTLAGKIALRVLIAAAAINVIDAAAEFAGLHGNRMMVRFGLGLMLGAASSLLITSFDSPATAVDRLDTLPRRRPDGHASA